MPRGPLPSASSRRRNAPTIPTTDLPAGGRRDARGRRLPAPKPPAGYRLATNGVAWWRWAWGTPQACAWSAGDLYTLARRARLEDDVCALREAPDSEFKDLVARLARPGSEKDLEDLLRRLFDVVAVLQGLAGNRASINGEMRQLEDRLGLTPKGLAQLRWRIVADQEPNASRVDEADDGATQKTSRSRHLKVADSAAVS